MSASRARHSFDGPAFVDTNVFVYMQDRSNQRKSKLARELVHELSLKDQVVISDQVLQEFASVAIGKLGLSLPETSSLIDVLAKLPRIPIDSNTVKAAVAIHFSHGLSFFDSLIIATASQGKCPVLYSEDMSDGQTITGVQVINPF